VQQVKVLHPFLLGRENPVGGQPGDSDPKGAALNLELCHAKSNPRLPLQAPAILVEEDQQYKKYDWIECRLQRSTKDPRPETYHRTNLEEIHPIGHIGTEDDWSERRDIVLKKAVVHHDLGSLIEGAKQNQLSLAVFRPTKLLDFVIEECDRDWDLEKLEAMRAQHAQLDLFTDKKPFELIPKLPYKFSYRFQDSSGRVSELMILDWEIGALYWNCRKAAGGNEHTALSKVKEKYLTEFSEKNLHFYLGTTQQFHQVGPNPWVIVGVLPIPHQRQLKLF